MKKIIAEMYYRKFLNEEINFYESFNVVDMTTFLKSTYKVNVFE